MLNEKALVKAIKTSTKSRLCVSNIEGTLYITNSYWAVKLERPTPLIQSEIIKAFGKLPQNGERFTLSYKSVSESGPEIQNLFNQFSLEHQAVVTGLHSYVDDNEVSFLRLNVDNQPIMAINRDYLNISSNPLHIMCSTSPNQPILIDEWLILSPVGYKGNKTGWRDYITEQLG